MAHSDLQGLLESIIQKVQQILEINPKPANLANVLHRFLEIILYNFRFGQVRVPELSSPLLRALAQILFQGTENLGTALTANEILSLMLASPRGPE